MTALHLLSYSSWAAGGSCELRTYLFRASHGAIYRRAGSTQFSTEGASPVGAKSASGCPSGRFSAVRNCETASGSSARSV